MLTDYSMRLQFITAYYFLLAIKPGHIVNSLHMPYTSVLDADKKIMRGMNDLTSVFKDAGVSLENPVVASCGSGEKPWSIEC